CCFRDKAIYTATDSSADRRSPYSKAALSLVVTQTGRCSPEGGNAAGLHFHFERAGSGPGPLPWRLERFRMNEGCCKTSGRQERYASASRAPVPNAHRSTHRLAKLLEEIVAIMRASR